MRPVAIELSAFGPFSATQRLAFDELAGNRLFLITGPTGSGKTTLLDGICFALYGDTSGAERDGRQMRSDNAGPDLLTEVIFDFALGERLLRVRRVPEQERAKRRGDGTTTQKSDATLWERTDAGPGDEGTVVATGWTGVTRAVEDLVGFSSEQFRQVIVLPQGKFRELLTASSEQREAILQRLFQTDRYLALQRALKDRASAVRRRWETLTERRKTLLEQAGEADEAALSARLEGLAGRVKGLETSLEPLRLAESAAAAALHQGRTLAQQFGSLAAAQQAARDLEATQGEFDGRRRRREQAERAASLDDLHRQLLEARARDEAAGTREQEAEKAAADAASALAMARSLLEGEEGKERAREGLQKRIDDLERFREEAGEVAAAAAERASAATALRAAEEASTEAAAAVGASRASLAEFTPRLEHARDGSARLDGLRQTLDAAQTRLQQHGRLTALRGESAALDALLRGAAAQRAAADAERSAAGMELERLSQALADGQAAVLASGLVDGEPCPVCGSRHHPEPARAGAAVPGSGELEDAKARLTAAEQGREAALSGLREAEKTIALAGQREEELVRALGDAVEAEAGALERVAAEARHAVEAAMAAHGALPGLEREASAFVQQQSMREAAQAAAAEEVGRLRSRLAAASAALAEREGRVPPEWRIPGAVEAALAAASEELQRARGALSNARIRHAEALETSSGTETLVAEARRIARESREALKALCDGWNARAAKAGFPGEGDYLAARIPEAERERLTREIEAYDAEVAAAGERLKVAAEAVEGQRPPDLGALEEAAVGRRVARERAEREKTALETTLAAERRTEAALLDTAKGLEAAAQEFAVAGRLAEVANGQNPFRLSFQRFVLTALLDDVLVAASSRLRRMSKGRYRLERVTAQGDQRVQGGLDLQVDDGYTGKVRPVSSLSGGESFLAALSLALGLAEVVEAYAGGVRLDTIFIDEGFGSLDPEALDLAVNTLVDLQSRGRLVGVISHVPELKERIDVRLELTSNRGSSTAAFSLP